MFQNATFDAVTTNATGAAVIHRTNSGANEPNTIASAPHVTAAVYWRLRSPEDTSNAFVGPVRHVDTAPTAAAEPGSTDKVAV